MSITNLCQNMLRIAIIFFIAKAGFCSAEHSKMTATRYPVPEINRAKAGKK